MAVVISLATAAMFNLHFYRFDGVVYQQRGGGPIGLRGTCGIARLMMQLFDGKWESVLLKAGINILLNCRYMDDGRTFLQPIKPGWRWDGGKLQYCKRWEREDYTKSPEERTKNVLLRQLNEIESYLKFTGEMPGDFRGGWLPTLDTSLKVTKNNKVTFKFYEKPEGSKRTVQKSTALEENSKMQIIANDLVRRFVNTSEELGDEIMIDIVDEYSQKLVNSGYPLEQVRRTVVSGIRGYGNRKLRCIKAGRKLRRTGAAGKSGRTRNKLLEKTSWYKRKGKEDLYGKKGQKDKQVDTPDRSNLEKKTVMFVPQTHKGELATKLRELFQRLGPVINFGIKVVERAGSSLKSKFPVEMGDKAPCGRWDCVTCTQGGEHLPDCTRQSVLYENICVRCNPGAGGKREPSQLRVDIPTLYVGESSRSIKERGGEHWATYRGGGADSHLLKHQLICHGGEKDPRFILRAVSFHRSALERQVSEAVRIRRRGGGEEPY